MELLICLCSRPAGTAAQRPSEVNIWRRQQVEHQLKWVLVNKDQVKHIRAISEGQFRVRQGKNKGWYADKQSHIEMEKKMQKIYTNKLTTEKTAHHVPPQDIKQSGKRENLSF